MKEFSYIAAGFCAATALVNLMTGQYVMGGIVLFLAVVNYKLAGTHE